jgi:hypothetical protein
VCNGIWPAPAGNYAQSCHSCVDSCDQLTAARDIARSFAGTEAFERSRLERKKIEVRFAHLKRILRLGRLRLRGPRGAQDEFVLAAIAQNLRRLASLVARSPPYAAHCFA